jgi:hypothetical protein
MPSWLPRPVYEAKPYVAVAVGLGCLVTAWFVETSPRGFLFIVGGALVTLGALLIMKRRDYRATQADYDPRAIDE